MFIVKNCSKNPDDFQKGQYFEGLENNVQKGLRITI